MKAIRRNFGKTLAILGAILAIQSPAWEYVRMKPDYRFIVEPWSIRGYETSEGFILSGIGVVLLALALIDRDSKPLMSVRRLHMLAGVAAWIGSMLFWDDLRNLLIDTQVEELGVGSAYKDTQITSGLMIAWWGYIIVTFGAIGMWAKRRDQLISIRRAERQREAAEQSALELEAALEAAKRS